MTDKLLTDAIELAIACLEECNDATQSHNGTWDNEIEHLKAALEVPPVDDKRTKELGIEDNADLTVAYMAGIYDERKRSKKEIERLNKMIDDLTGMIDNINTVEAGTISDKNIGSSFVNEGSEE